MAVQSITVLSRHTHTQSMRIGHYTVRSQEIEDRSLYRDVECHCKVRSRESEMDHCKVGALKLMGYSKVCQKFEDR